MAKRTKDDRKMECGYKFCPIDGKPLAPYNHKGRTWDGDPMHYLTCDAHVWSYSDCSYKDYDVSFETLYYCKNCSKHFIGLEGSCYGKTDNWPPVYCEPCGDTLYGEQKYKVTIYESATPVEKPAPMPENKQLGLFQ